MRGLPGNTGSLKSSHRGCDPADPVAHHIMTDTTTSDNDTDCRHERRLQVAKRLLAAADADDTVIADCRQTLSQPTYQRSRAQATMDAASVLLALQSEDISTKRTREATQLLYAVVGGRC